MGARALIVLTLLSAPLSVAVAGHGAAIESVDLPYWPGEGDAFALEERFWNPPRGNEEGTIFDLESLSQRAADAVDRGELEYLSREYGFATRVHGDAAAIEMVLLPPREEGKGAPQPVFNAGMRVESLLFDPPLPLAVNRSIEGLFLAPLEWARATVHHDEGDDQERRSIVLQPKRIPAPDEAGVIPPTVEEAPSKRLAFEDRRIEGLLRWNTTFVRTAEARDGSVHSPAMAHVALDFGLPEHRLSKEVTSMPQGRTSFNVTLSLLFDFGGSPQGSTFERTEHPDAHVEGGAGASAATKDAAWRGLMVNQTRRYVELAASPLSHDPFATFIEPGRTNVTVTAGHPLPQATPRPLLAPIRFNVTVPLMLDLETQADEDGHRLVLRAGWRFQVGFRMAESAPEYLESLQRFEGAPERPSGGTEGEDANDTPAPSVPLVLAAAMAALAAVRSGGSAGRRR